MTKNKYLIGMRWILILPASIAGYLLIQILMLICKNSYKSFNLMPEDSFINSVINIIFEFINLILAPYCFVLAGAITAPKHPFAVAVILTIFQAVFILGSLFFNIALFGQSAGLTWVFIGGAIGGIIAMMIACLQAYTRFVDFSSPT